ncbi:Ser-Thr-rich, GPI-anchored family protein [Metarhizium robertsii]|uniref:Uncharacterized protein n=2 Tax=Metarhizium robertsii TaxID=568076 RepID=E9ER69_METRA|nr:uncharacterized protein MAA_03111 [Metarhizium robertsii ARSEF 23]EFZ01882.1 hypothetical protein MAA_03111 [Metarhizium robertsii ARSEF 23]EXV02376.1 Ser-Thr-rich, GPI-anchored family protein [Metarhizium robertsii]
MLRRTLTSLLATTILPLATCQFTSPAAGAVLSAGDKVNVSYTTDLKNYTIALWQRAEEGGRPRLGSVVYAATDGPSSSFTWTVQTYALDLAASPTFFFWLFEGGPSRQGSDPHQLSSGYFNVTDKSASSPVSVSAAESASTTAAAAPSPSPAESAPGDPLSVGARAGLGAAVSVFCLVVAALVFLFFWRRARKRARRDGEAPGSGGGGAATDYTESVAELQSECVSLGAPGKLPCRVYQPVPGDASSRPPALAELPA